MLSPVVLIRLSGPGLSTSRSRSLMRVPSLGRVFGGSGQESAIRSCPAAIAFDWRATQVFPVPHVELSTHETALLLLQTCMVDEAVFTPETVKVFSVQPAPAGQLIGEVLLMGGSPVASVS